MGVVVGTIVLSDHIMLLYKIEKKKGQKIEGGGDIGTVVLSDHTS